MKRESFFLGNACRSVGGGQLGARQIEFFQIGAAEIASLTATRDPQPLDMLRLKGQC